jgi:hypothetical protein
MASGLLVAEKPPRAILGFVRRAVLVIFLALLTFDVSDLSSLVGETDCDESCPTDLPGGQCPPNCHYCSCCSLPQVTQSTIATLVAPSACDASWVSPSDGVIAPEPADILHVPKSPLA